uniref:28S ribosomal protein S22, mitochondrial n=1 Tax=Daphnia magna TaxID=35525 RepID=A0A0P4WQX4_9CRUS
MATRAVMFTIGKFRCFPILKNRVAKFTSSSNLLNTSTFDPGDTRDPSEVFFKENVQALLDRLTGRDYEKVFQNRKLGQRLEPPKYELLTQAEVDQVMVEMEVKLKKKLQMPPLLKEREPVTKILSKDPELQGFDNCKYVFIDISQGINDRKREVVVRDPNGVLRDASWEERQKMCQIYFPLPGRQISMPKMFEETHLQDCLDQGQYQFVLDRACAQFEPDDPDYIRVTRKTYNCIDENNKFSTLRSTRHFGPMVLHLVLCKRMDNLLFHFITSKEVKAAADLVRLFHLVWSDSSPSELDEFQSIENYIQGPAVKKPALELAWQTFLEIEKQRLEALSQQNKASN